MQKRFLIWLLTAALLLGLTFPAQAADGAKYKVTAAKANVLSEPNAELTYIAQLPKGSVIEVDEVKNGFGHFTLRSGDLSGWVYMGLLEYVGGTEENTENVARIYIRTLPKKTSYIEGEEAFDPAGLTLYAAYTDGKSDALLQGCQIYAPDLSSYGEKTVWVFYTAPGGAVFSASFPVTVTKVPVSALVLTPPDKTEYIEGQPLDLTGLTATLVYADGRPDETYGVEELLAAPGFRLMGCHSETQGTALTRGEHTLTLYYLYPEINAFFTVTAAKKTLISFSVETPPDSLVTYSDTGVPDLTGLVLTAGYDNGEFLPVKPSDCRIECSPQPFVLGSGNRVTLTYGEKSVTLEFTYAQDPVVGIELQTPTVLSFVLGEPVDLRDLRVWLVRASGAKSELTEYTLSGIDPSVSGQQTAVVSGAGYSALLPVNITPFHQCGDVDGDSYVTAADARMALRAAVGLTTLSGEWFTSADTDKDGDITSADARRILRAAVGLEELVHFDENSILLRNGAIV